MSLECETTTAEATLGDRYTACVKWFNNKAGYGFITVKDGEQAGNDIFVHHSNIKVDSQQYKYLVQGEYVEFNICKTDGGSHEYQAQNVSGIKGGKLMCETRFDTKSQRSNYATSERVVERSSEPVKMPVQRRPAVQRSESNGWVDVVDGTQKKPRGRPAKPAGKV